MERKHFLLLTAAVISALLLFASCKPARRMPGDDNILKIEKDPKTGISTITYKKPISLHGKKSLTARLFEIKADEDGNLNAFPGFENECDAVSFFDEMRLKNKPKYVSYRVSMDDSTTDGRLSLSIHPNILILSTGHSNPNPSDIEWYEFITRPQYDVLIGLLKKRANDVSLIASQYINDGSAHYGLNPFYKQMPFDVRDRVSEKERDFTDHVVLEDRDNYKCMSVAYLLELANREIPDKSKKIRVPGIDEISNFNSVKISLGTLEIEDGMIAVSADDKGTVDRTWDKGHYGYPENVTMTVTNNKGDPVYLSFTLESVYDEKTYPVTLNPGEEMLAAGAKREYVFDFHKMLGKKYSKGYYSLHPAYSEKPGGKAVSIGFWDGYFKAGGAMTVEEIFRLKNKYDVMSQLYSKLKARLLKDPGTRLNRAELTFIDVYDLRWILGYDAYNIAEICSYIAIDGKRMAASLKTIGSGCTRDYLVKLMSMFPDGKIMPDNVKIQAYVDELGKKDGHFFENMNFRDYSRAGCNEDLLDSLYKYAGKHKNEFTDER